MSSGQEVIVTVSNNGLLFKTILYTVAFDSQVKDLKSAQPAIVTVVNSWFVLSRDRSWKLLQLVTETVLRCLHSDKLRVVKKFCLSSEIL